MHVSRRLSRVSLALLAGAAPLLFALTLPPLQGAPASSRPDTAPAETPQQVADTLDSIVQPRFQQNAGRFGVERVVLKGHDNVYGLQPESPSERRRLRQVNAAHRPYVIAFLHCAHRPGKDLVTRTVEVDPPVQLAVMTLAAATATDAGSQRLLDWGDANLGKAVLPAWPVLKQGSGVGRDFGNWQVVMRPVRASRASCLSCHAGAKRGDTLGVMVYAVDKDPIRASVKSFNEGDL